MRKISGEVTLDIGPGIRIRICAPGGVGDGVGVFVGSGVGGIGVSVGVEVTVGGAIFVSASMVFMAEFAVNAMTVGRYSAGYGVGTGSVIWSIQADKRLRRDAANNN